jgi:adenine-specific DNA-methyltransferase
MERYIHKDITSYIFLNGDVETEDDLKEKYPTFYELLKSHKEKLELRYNYNRKINYWEWVFLRSFNLFKQEKERIFVPCKERISHKQYFRFSYVPSGIFPTQDVTAIFPKSNVKESIYYILALLSSEYVFEWLKHKGVVKGNIVEFSEKPLASIPIRLIDWNNPTDKKLHEEISSLCKSYIETNDEYILENLNQKVSALF